VRSRSSLAAPNGQTLPIVVRQPYTNRNGPAGSHRSGEASSTDGRLLGPAKDQTRVTNVASRARSPFGYVYSTTSA